MNQQYNSMRNKTQNGISHTISIIYVKNGTERIAYQMKRLHGGVEESDRTEV